MAYQNQRAFFKFDRDFLERSWEISPFKLSTTTEIVEAESKLFDGMFGVFNDSLPDGWGRLLLDRALEKKGIKFQTLTPLDRLAYVGKRGMGALIYEPPSEEQDMVSENFDLDQLAQEAQKVLSGTPAELLDTLFSMGGSSGGARPKITIGFHPKTGQFVSDSGELPVGFESWLIKFPASNDYPDIAQIEYAYYLMAQEAGIAMSPSRLFEGKSGTFYFGTKRFDRIVKKRLHMHSASGLLHDNFRLSNLDYGHLMDAAFRLERKKQVYEKVLRLAAFNVFAHNRDDHSKNFSFLMNEQGGWSFAPAYDLTFSHTGYGHHSTTIAGEGETPGKEHIQKLANIFSVEKAGYLIEQVEEAVSRWSYFAKEASVSPATQQIIQRQLNRLRSS